MRAMVKLAHLHSLLKTDSRTQKTGRKLAPGLREEGELRAVPVIHGSSGTPTHLPGTTWDTETDLSATSTQALRSNGEISRIGRNNRIFIPLIHIQFFCVSSSTLSFPPLSSAMHMRFGCISHLNESSFLFLLFSAQHLWWTQNTYALLLPVAPTWRVRSSYCFVKRSKINIKDY